MAHARGDPDAHARGGDLADAAGRGRAPDQPGDLLYQRQFRSILVDEFQDASIA
jgi:hypothetical protein